MLSLSPVKSMPVGQLGIIRAPVRGRRRRKEIRVIRLKALLSVIGSPVFIVSRRGTLSLIVLSGKHVSTGRHVLCRGMSSVEYYDYVHVELACLIVTTAAQLAVADTLPVDRVDFLLGNDLAGARVFPSPVPVVEAPADRVVASS